MRKVKKGIAFLLCIAMLFGICPTSVYATGSEAANEQIDEQMLNQIGEQSEETIVELEWTSCQYWEDGVLLDNIDFVKASGKGIESVSAIWKTGYEELLRSLYGEEEDFSVYDVSVEGYTEGESLSLSFEIVPFTDGIDELKLYYITEAAEGPVAEELPILEVIDDADYEIVTFETTKTGVFAVGNVKEVAEEEPQTGELIIKELPTKLVYQLGEAFAVSGLEVIYVENDVETILPENEYEVTADLSKNGQQTVTVSYGELTASFDIWVCDPNNPINVGISVKELPTKTAYEVGETFDAAGLKVVVHYDNGTEQEIGTYILSEADTMTPGFNPVTVTSGNYTTVFYIAVKELQPELVEADETVTLEDGSKITVKIESSAFENVTYKITDVHNYIWVNTLLSEVYDGEFIALDIQPDENFIPGEKTTVTLPLPDHITSPAVYCLTKKDGIVERMMDVTVENGMVSFVTDHFSVYAVVDAEGRVPKPAMLETDVWVPVTAIPSAGDQVLILDRKTVGQANALSLNGNSIANNNVTIQKFDDQVYILDDDTVNSTAKWKVSSGLKFQNIGNTRRYLSYSSSTLNTDNFAKNFTYDKDANTLSYTYTGYSNYRPTTYTCYLTHDGSQWTTSSNPANVYLFKKDTLPIPYQLELGVEGETVTAGRYVYGELPILETKRIIPSGIPYAGEIVYRSGNTDILTVNDKGEITFTGEAGNTYIEAVYTFNVDGKTYTSTNYLEILVTTPQYEVDILDKDGNSIKKTIPIKNVTEGMTERLQAKVTRNGMDITDDVVVEWRSYDESIATVDASGNVTFTGKEGNVRVNVIYTYADGSSSLTDAVLFSVKRDNVIIPSDGTSDFPEYPNEGSIRFDKHATAVGNFSDTGVVQVELSMTGIPYTKGSEIDVVMMLDMSTSINDEGKTPERYNAAIEAAQRALEILVKNEDGSFNENRVAIYGFNGWGDDYDNHIEDVYDYISGSVNNPNTTNYNISKISDMQSYNSDTFTETYGKIKSEYKLEAGTNYAAALRQCYLTLAATKQEGRKQYVIFMTDGFATTGFAEYLSDGSRKIYNTDSDQLNYNGLNGVTKLNLDEKKEYYSTKMKEAGVEIFSVGLYVGAGITYSDKNQETEAVTAGETVLKNIAGFGDKNATSSDYANHALFVKTGQDVDELVKAFEKIAQGIKQAATNVVVTDKIADEYTMIFDIPEGHATEVDLPAGQELYIEVLDYKLNAVTSDDGTIVDYARGESTSLAKVYLAKDKNNNNNFYAAVKTGEDAQKNPVLEAAETPAFEAVEGEERGYWKLSDSSDYDVKVGNQNYKFAPKGDGAYIMKSGAYASGTENGNLKIATPYFFYDASTRILVWTSEKLSSSELALSYFLYLDESAGCEGESHQRLPGTYETNDYATLRYTNHLGNECEQEFPIPQMTWNGAQVSYVFYLVNDSGQPVNRSGRVVPFSEAVYITDVFTESIVWNDLEETDRLTADILAEDLVPDIYKLYDETAAYTIHVFEDETGANLNNHFKIEGSEDKENTTYVFNTKSDAQKYIELGIYSRGADFLCKDYNVTFADGTYTYGGDPENQYQDEEQNFIYGMEKKADGTKVPYTIVYKASDYEVNTSFDFSNTTVAFAVVWIPKLKPDTVVIDYGLDTVIDVAYNDGITGTVVGVRKDPYPNAPLDGDNGYSNMCDAEEAKVTDVYLDNSNGDNFKIGTAAVENDTSVRFSLDKENGMQMRDWAKFYYESTMSYYETTNSGNQELKHQDMYTSVTVIPATTIYYEDEYVTFSTLEKQGSNIVSKPGWKVDSQAATKTQQVDRPGPDKVAALYDADNEYGSDAAYLQCSQASMGSSAMINVGANNAGTAEFEFYGTGFDVISMTSNTTGMIVVEVSDGKEFLKTYVVDTYYGYKYVENPEDDFNNNGDPSDDHWVIDPSANNSLWQVPVIKVEELAYGKYNVKITATYSRFFDHDQYNDSTYDFYLDAIRIYDPAGRDDEDNLDELIKNAYISDREYLPKYYELRNMVIEADTFGKINGPDTIAGIVFIDGTTYIDGKEKVTTKDISNYISYGPNNELYLAPGQIVVFNLNAKPEDGYAVDMVQLAWKSVGGTAKAKIWNPGKMNAASAEVISVKTATDMYFDITNLTDLKQKTVVIQNAGEKGDSILSITNIKVTAKEAPAVEEPPTGQEMAMFSISRAAVEQALLSLNNEIVEPEPPTPEPPAPEPPKTEVEKPAPESPKAEVEKPAPELPKTEVEKPVQEAPVQESPKTEETTTPKEETEKPATETTESVDDKQVGDDLESQESEIEESKEPKEKGIIGKLIEFIKLLVRSIIDWFSRWF